MNIYVIPPGCHPPGFKEFCDFLVEESSEDPALASLLRVVDKETSKNPNLSWYDGMFMAIGNTYIRHMAHHCQHG